MFSFRRLSILSATIFFSLLGALAQDKLQVTRPEGDPLELANSATDVPDNPQARAAVLNLLEQARQNANLRTAGGPAFVMRLTFSASGDVLFTGTGEMEETWLSLKSHGWSARLGDFSLRRVFAQGAEYDDKPVSMIPIRIQMLRDAVLWPVRVPEAAELRTATANWKGLTVTCVLTSGAGVKDTTNPGRRWVEREYCVDPKSGLLQVLSDAPGIYVTYDYSGAAEFHGHRVPREITITEAGKTVLQAHLDLLSDATQANASHLQPTQDMLAQGPGPILSIPMRFPHVVRTEPGAKTMQPVIVHAILADDGKVLDAELLDSSGAPLAKTALDLVKQTSYVHTNPGLHLQREAFINVKFVSD